MNDVLARLAVVVESRKHSDAKESYVASLYAGGLDTILKKIGEEATETIIAAKGDDRQALIREIADLWFHCLVLLAREGLHPDDVLRELEHRVGTSGHIEKAARGSESRPG